MFLGVDGGGTKTAFVLLDRPGRVLATATGGSTYYPEVGLAAVREVLASGIREVLASAGVAAHDIEHAFFGIPAFGEDTAADAELVRAPEPLLPRERYTCGNDMVCSWAGALACADGISVIAGTGSIAYGEYHGGQARAGGWGEVFGDEGSAYWIAREGLAAFSRMSDGRLPAGPLQAAIRSHFNMASDLDVAGRINGQSSTERSSIAQLARLVADAARAGDATARGIYTRAGAELAAIAVAVAARLAVPTHEALPVSYSGGVFAAGPLVLEPLAAALATSGRGFRLQPPLLPPVLGAAIYAARRAGVIYSTEQLQLLGRSNQ
jgi:N-acetylglucosamine kinase-like BadF-type ATPase